MEQADADHKLGKIALWTGFCVCIVLGSLGLLFLASATAQDSMPAFFWGFLVAGPSTILVLVCELELGYHHDPGPWVVGLVIFVAQWTAIWAIGFVSLRRKGRIPLLKMGGALLAGAVVAAIVFFRLV